MESIKPHFNFTEKDYREPTLMAQYNALTGFKEVVRVNLLGKTYNLYDQYCKNPDCDCTETDLDLVLFENGEKKAIHSFAYDYVTKRLKQAKSPLPTGLIQALKQNEDLHILFALRNQAMRVAFKAYCHERILKKTKRLLLPSNTVRRNEPCPCGSGSKYKNCCGK